MSKSPETVALMYHGITSSDSQTSENREAGAQLYDVSLEHFREQMEYIKKNNYCVTAIAEGGNINETRIIITFDDGESNNFKNAFPVLKNYSFPAYFFVTVNRIGKGGYMDWEEIKELRDAGMVIGSHGLNHAILTTLKDKQIERELIDSKEILERNLKINIEYFAVPRGFDNDRILAMAQKAGYKKVFVSDAAQNADNYCIPRIVVRASWSVQRFAQILEGKIPISDTMVGTFKKLFKNMLGAARYDSVRKAILEKKSWQTKQ